MKKNKCASSYHVKKGGDTFANIAKSLYGTDVVADKIAAYNGMTPDTPLDEGVDIKLPARAFHQTAPPQKENRRSVIPIAVHQPELCWVSFQEEVPTRVGTTKEELDGKWVYIVADGKVVVTVDAKPGEDWDVDNALLRKRKRFQMAGCLCGPVKSTVFSFHPSPCLTGLSRSF